MLGLKRGSNDIIYRPGFTERHLQRDEIFQIVPSIYPPSTELFIQLRLVMTAPDSQLFNILPICRLITI